MGVAAGEAGGNMEERSLFARFLTLTNRGRSLDDCEGGRSQLAELPPHTKTRRTRVYIDGTWRLNNTLVLRIVSQEERQT